MNDNEILLKREELLEELKEVFPEAFTNTYFYGLECDIGWGDILKEILTELKEVISSLKDWSSPVFRVAQIKEKFGGLRFYIDFNQEVDENFTLPNDVVVQFYNIIEKGEDKSFSVCEYCGKEGELRRLSWLKTLCDNCFQLKGASHD